MADYVEILRQSELDKLESVPAKLLAILQGIENINKNPVNFKGLNESLTALKTYEAQATKTYAAISKAQMDKAKLDLLEAKSAAEKSKADLNAAKSADILRKSTEEKTNADQKATVETEKNTKATNENANAIKARNAELAKRNISDIPLIITNETQAVEGNSKAVVENTAINADNAAEHAAANAATARQSATTQDSTVVVTKYSSQIALLNEIIRYANKNINSATNLINIYDTELAAGTITELQHAEAVAAKNESIERNKKVITDLTVKLEVLNAAEIEAISLQEGIAAATIQSTAAQKSNNNAINASIGSESGKGIVGATSGFKKLWGVVRQAAYILPGIGISGILMIIPSVITSIIDAIRESKSLADALNNVKLAAKTMMAALSSSEVQDAIKNVIELKQNIKLAKEGILDKTKVLHEYNDTIGKTTGEVGSLNEAEQSLIKNADAYVKVTLYKTAANLAATDAAKKLLEAEKDRRKADAEFQNTIIDNPSSGTYGGMGGYTPGPDQNTDATRAAAAKRRKEEAIKRATDEANAQLSIAEKFQKDAASLAKKNGFDFFGGTQTEKVKKQRVKRETDTVNEIVEARRKLTDSQRDLALTEQNIIIEKNKTIFEDERKSNDERAAAYAEMQDAKLQINQLNFDKEISDTITWEAQYNGEVQKALATDEKLRTEHQKRILIDAETNKNNRIRIEAEFNYANVKILEESARYINDTYNNIDKSIKESVDKTISDAGIRLQRFITNRQKQQNRDYKHEQKMLKEHADIMASLSQSVLDTVSGVSAGLTQSRLNDLDLENEKIQQNLKDQLDAIALSGDSEIEKQKKVSDAEGRAAAQTKAIADEQRRLKTEQAKQDKAITIANIILKTALAVVTALTEGDPFTKIPRAIAAGALGASQLAVAIATPIPQYAKGTEYHPGGLAWEGDGGEKELNIEPSGKMYWSPDTATLMNPVKGTKVIPEHILMQSILNGQSSLNGGSLATSKDNAYLAEIAKGNKRIENAIKSQERLSVNIDRYGFDVSSQRGNSWTKYENSRIHR